MVARICEGALIGSGWIAPISRAIARPYLPPGRIAGHAEEGIRWAREPIALLEGQARQAPQTRRTVQPVRGAKPEVQHRHPL